MPEGDSIASDAVRLRQVLDGEVIEAIYGSSGSVRSNSSRVVGRTVLGIRTVGKNLVVDFDSGFSLRVHLAMNGRWLILPRQRKIPGPAKVALTTATDHAVCLAAPTVELDRTKVIDHRLKRLGPDLLDPHFDTEEAIRRIRLFPAEPIGRTLLDQRVVAGIGNVYKSELAFLAGIHPHLAVSRVTDDQLEFLLRTARKVLKANVGPGRRSTTGSRSGPGSSWVYGRSGLLCRECGTIVVEGRLDERISFWCPSCQPAAMEPA